MEGRKHSFEHTTLNLKSKSRQEMAVAYGISVRTFRRWLKRNGIQLPRGLIRPKDILVIYDRLGKP